MNFTLTREQDFVRKMVREFAEAEVAPIAMRPVRSLLFSINTAF